MKVIFKDFGSELGVVTLVPKTVRQEDLGRRTSQRCITGSRGSLDYITFQAVRAFLFSTRQF